MTITQSPDDTRFFEDERLELVDLQNSRVATIRREMHLLEAILGEPSTPRFGWVLKGFSLSHSPSTLDVTIAATEGIAVDGDGKIVYNPGDSTVTVTLPGSSVIMLYAYMREVDTAVDARKRWDRSTPAEVSITTETRIRQQVGFYFSATLDLTHTMTPNQQTVALVPIHKFETDGTGVVVGANTVDARNMFGDLNDGLTIPSTAGKGIVGIWSAFSTLATRLKQIVDKNAVISPGWYDQSTVRDVYTIDTEVKDARTSLVSGGATSLTLSAALHRARMNQVNVGDGTNTFGDFNGVAGVKSALELNHATGGGIIHIKRGVYNGVDTVTMPMDAVHVQGIPGEFTTNGTQWIPVVTGSSKKLDLSGRNSILFDGIFFDRNSGSNDWHMYLASCSNITFRNCSFRQGASCTGPMIVLDDATNVTFENCRFVNNNVVYSIVQLQGSTLDENVLFYGCTVSAKSTWIGCTGLYRNVRVESCKVVLASGGTSLSGVIYANLSQLTSHIEVRDCDFVDGAGGAFLYIINATAATATTSGYGYAHIENCRFRTISAGGVKINALGTPSRVVGCKFESTTNNAVGIQLLNLGSGASAEATVIERNEFVFGSGSTGQIGIAHSSDAGTNAFSPICIERNMFLYGQKGVVFTSNSSVTSARICNNTFRSVGQPIQVIGTVIADLCISSNRIIGGGGVPLTVSTFAFCFGICVVGGTLDGLVVEGNRLNGLNSSYTSGPSAGILIEGVFNHVRVDGNQLRDNGTTDAGVSDAHKKISGGIILHAVTTKGTCLDVTNNKVIQGSWGSCIYFDIGNAASAVVGVEQLVMSQNLCRNTLGSTGYVGCLKISDHFDAVVSSAGSNGILQAAINGNVVRDTGTDSSSFALSPIETKVGENGSYYYFPNVLFTGNQVITARLFAISIYAATDLGAGVVVGNKSDGATDVAPFAIPGASSNWVEDNNLNI